MSRIAFAFTAIGTVVLAFPAAWIASGIADHTPLTKLTWLYAPGFPLALLPARYRQSDDDRRDGERSFD